jgi:hypothetical protein
MHDIIQPGETEIPHQSHGIREIVIVGQNRATLKRIEKLGGMKTQNLTVSEIADHGARIGTTECVSGIKKES